MDSSYLAGQLKELDANRSEADITFKCQGELFKAHSFLLAMRFVNHVSMMLMATETIRFLFRSKYLRKKLSTSSGDQNRVIEVFECPPRVLAPTINFMYGIAIPEDFSSQDVKSLLYMAHLYDMEDLKDAVAPRIGDQLNLKNILEISKMALKFNALKLTEICCDFILANVDGLSSSLLDQLFKVMPFKGMVAKRCFRVIDIADKVLGVNLATTFKNRKDFLSDSEYQDYIMKTIRPNMLVVSKKSQAGNLVHEGALGRVVRCDMSLGPLVKWISGNTLTIPFLDLEILTPPINVVPLAEIL